MDFHTYRRYWAMAGLAIVMLLPLSARDAFAAVRPAMDALTAGPHELVELPQSAL